LVRQPEAGERHAREADTESLQCRAARDGLGHALCEFIEFVVHTFPFVVFGLVLRFGFIAIRVAGAAARLA